MKKKILSGMRPTGKLHLGHWAGALDNWAKLQEEYECFFMVADWHALMSEYENTKVIAEYAIDNVIDWLASGVDPKKSTLFIQSQVPQHCQLHMILSCLVPLGWLERCPTYKEQLREVKTRDLNTYGFLGYPVLQAADILLYKAQCVPVGEDQLPHLELAREISRRFNSLYKKEVFGEAEALLTKFPRLLGLDGRKMSKSYNNTINLSDSPDEVRKKAASMVTDPQRIKLIDPGHPEICNVYAYYSTFIPEMKKDVYDWCVNAKIGCTECKKRMAEGLIKKLEPFSRKRAELAKDKGRVIKILSQGREKAADLASQTIKEAEAAMGMSI